MHKNKWWFILIISIFIVLSVIIILFIWVNIISKNRIFIEEQIKYDSFENKANNTVNIIAKYNKALNSNWLWNDELVCSWWLIDNSKINWAVCLWNWIAWNDFIDDKCNNDDNIPYFADKTISLWDLFTNSSLLIDDDSDARINNIGFIYPWEQKTIFYFDKTIGNKIIWSADNIYYSLPEIGKYTTMLVSINWWDWLSWSMSIDTKIWDEYNYFVNSKKSNIILNSSWTLSDDASLNWTQPFVFDLSNDKSYIINITNPTNKIINYNLILKDNKNIPIYQVPITDNDYWINLPYYEWKIENYDFLMRKIDIYTKNKN